MKTIRTVLCQHYCKNWIVGVAMAVAAIVIGGASTCFAQGEIWGWGAQVVVGQESLMDLTAVAGGLGHSLGLNADGSIVAWGCEPGWPVQSCPAPNADFVAVAAGVCTAWA